MIHVFYERYEHIRKQQTFLEKFPAPAASLFAGGIIGVHQQHFRPVAEL
jgi:hypothetical protein